MQQFFRLSAAPMAGLWAMALMAVATPASAADYCRQDAISGMRACGYATIEQCQAMSSGIGGTCYRDPFLPQAGANGAHAYAPHDGKAPREPLETEVDMTNFIKAAGLAGILVAVLATAPGLKADQPGNAVREG